MSIEIPGGAYNPQGGALALLPKRGEVMNWFTCREQFHGAITKRTKDRNFLFATNTGLKQNIINFMDEVQDRLCLNSAMRLRFRDTNQANVLYVETDPWWNSQNIRISFLTALLRCGQGYTGENFKGALYSLTYTSQTKPAVDRFLDGFTHYLGTGSQWHATFNHYRNRVDLAERMLVKEEDAKVTDEAMQEAKHIVDFAKDDTILVFMLARSLDMFYKKGIEDSGIKLSPVRRETKVFGEKIDETENG